jgi:diacylglycerol O-acyltransferase / wax synthase
VNTARLSPLDSSFLAVESPTAHMHVGWAALFASPHEGPRPSFADLRAHIGRRLDRAPRYRQRLAQVPFAVHNPVWVDDDRFDLSRHVHRAASADIREVIDDAMSAPLDQEIPLWQLWIADNLSDGRIAVVGKAHHCMVDGIAAVELAGLLLDPTMRPPSSHRGRWKAAPVPGAVKLLAQGLRDRLLDPLALFGTAFEIVSSPRRIIGLPEDLMRTLRALGHSVGAPAPPSMLNGPISAARHLALLQRPLDDLKQVASHDSATTVNDVVLAAACGGMRRFLISHDEQPVRLKAMVPVNLRDLDAAGDLGNRISFLFVDLPCDEPDPVRRLRTVHAAMSDRKAGGEPQGGESVLGAVAHAPHLLQHMVSRLMASPRAFNLVVSNIPGPKEPLYMLGCELEEVYPVVPLADRHAVSIGLTTIGDGAFFGIYADPESLPDVEPLAAFIDQSIDELLSATSADAQAGDGAVSDGPAPSPFLGIGPGLVPTQGG